MLSSFLLRCVPSRAKAHGGAVAMGLMLGACSLPPAFETGALAPVSKSDAGRTAAQGTSSLAAAHKAKPDDPGAARAYARALRATGAKAEALAVLDTTAARSKDRPLALERGLLALELGQAEKAEAVLRQADDGKAADWRLHSGLGAALASRGKHQEAQVQFAKALTLAPDHPAVLNNLALSYALEGRVEEAEKLLRKAERAKGAGPEVKQNLALVLGLRGRFDDAKSTAASSVLGPAKAAANVAYLQSLAKAKKAEGETAPAVPKTSASLTQPTYRLGAPRTP